MPSESTSSSEFTPATPRPASATALLRARVGGGVEVFMVRRHVQSEFVPDVYVFPGGSVKEADQKTEIAEGMCDGASDDVTPLGAGFRVAAIRELFEEAGALIALRDGKPLAMTDGDKLRFAAYRDQLNHKALTLEDIARRGGLTLATASLLRWAHWVTPEAWPKRFDTHFFLVETPEGQEPKHDALEVTDSVWIRPEDALERHERNEFPIVFATIHQLRDLCALDSLADARARFTGRTPVTIRPRIVKRNGQDVILMPDEPDPDHD